MKIITLAPRKIFLLDSLGALLSAFLLGVVLAKLEAVFGMPAQVLYFLSCIACVLAVYSFLSYWLVKRNWKPYMQAIAAANLLYCGLTYTTVQKE